MKWVMHATEKIVEKFATVFIRMEAVVDIGLEARVDMTVI
jgi:hypothetical protein